MICHPVLSKQLIIVMVMSGVGLSCCCDCPGAQGSKPGWAASVAARKPANAEAITGSSVDTPGTLTLFQTAAANTPPQFTDGRIVEASLQTSAASTTVLKPTPEPPVTAADSESTTQTDLSTMADFASQLPEEQVNLLQIIEIMQWTVVVLMIAVVAVVALKKYKGNGPVSGSSAEITHLATLPVRNHFQAHLLAIGRQQFLVTTDRSGVKTVNPITRWEDFANPVAEVAEDSAS